MNNHSGGDGAFLHRLEVGVKEELAMAETSKPLEDGDGVPTEEWLNDPYAPFYEVRLRTVLGAIEAAEGGSRGTDAPSAPKTAHTEAGKPQAAHEDGLAVAHDGCLALVRASDRPIGPARYRRMFPDLAPLAIGPGPLENAGGSGGICDVDQANKTKDGDDGREAAGWPLFGQLIAHDITADRSPLTGGPATTALRNARAPRLDLEILYSDGPIGSAYLFDRADPVKFLLGPDGRDVPRNNQGTALIGDPRDDVHLFVLTLHVRLLRAHNRIVDLLRAADVPEKDVFDRARITLAWHYQWTVVHDFLPRLVGRPLVSDILIEGGRWFTPPSTQAYIPLEFADAAFRYGHSQIRHAYRLTADGPAIPLFPDLLGIGPQHPGHRLDLDQIFDMPGRPLAQRAKRIDGRLPASLISLPEPVTGAVDIPAHHSLAARDLLRGDSTSLPSGEAIARRIGAQPLTAAELGHSWPDGTPLWLYVLKEAEHRGDGDRLGPVGGRIVAEVLIGLLHADPTSYLSLQRDWQPTLPASADTYGLADLLTLGDLPPRVRPEGT